MDLLMIAYAVLTTILSTIMVEEVRDLHYFPLLGTLGLTLAGIVLAGGVSSLIPPAFMTTLTIALAAASTIMSLAFFYDLRKIARIERDAIIFEKKAHQLYGLNSALYSSAINLKSNIVKQTATLAQASNETTKSIEAIHIG